MYTSMSLLPSVGCVFSVLVYVEITGILVLEAFSSYFHQHVESHWCLFSPVFPRLHCGALGPDASCRGVQWDVTPGHSIPRGALLGNWPSWTALWSLAGLFPRHKPFLGTAPAPCSSSHPWRGLCGHTASPHRSDQGWTPRLR